MTKTAVHFGAGNIGRGFVGLLLHEAGYRVTFVDVNADLIDALRAAGSYTVREVGGEARTHHVGDISAINSATDEASAIQAIAEADVVTCAVGPVVLQFIAPVIRAGLAARDDSRAPLAVMACENAIGATDTLAGFVLDGAAELGQRAVFANTAVDRIVPAQDARGVDVTVEDFYEWTIDARPFAGNLPTIPGAHFVDDLMPFIERKLFTVNTGHATTAYHGFLAGAESIAEALRVPEVRAHVEAALAETSALLVSRFGLDRAAHAAYVARALQRFENEALPDSCERIGRQPLRKLSRHERFVRPAALLAEQGQRPVALVAAMVAATKFAVADDEQSVEMRRLRADLDTADFVTTVTELEPEHPLHGMLVAALDAD